MPTKRAGSAEADPSREGEEGRRDTPPPPPPKVAGGETSTATLLSRTEGPGPAPSDTDTDTDTAPAPRHGGSLTEGSPRTPQARRQRPPLPRPRSTRTATAPTPQVPGWLHQHRSSGRSCSNAPLWPPPLSFYYKPAAIARPPGATGWARPRRRACWEL